MAHRHPIMEAFSRSDLPHLSQRPSAKASPILSTPRHPSNQRTIASWDHPPPVLTCQDITPVSVSTSPVTVYKDLFPLPAMRLERRNGLI